ncbi:unnamed protein product [Anisakis simplex]|uniref:CCHC-type domain-containing protein n=1 Tax=Anisakis simplex TaxID=6269 RepID=A0A3P6R2C0_ANISI|nr:unnamed protein product [Anisakis simplex]
MPQWALLEIYNEKQRVPEWSVDQLCSKLQIMVKIREQIKWSNPAERSKPAPQLLSQINKPEATSAFVVGQQKFNQNRQADSNNRKKNEPNACPFCNGRHWANQCERFKSTESRTNRAKQLQLCVRCLKRGHFSKDCTNKRPCYYCRSSGHHQALCNNAQPHQLVATTFTQQQLTIEPAAYNDSCLRCN